MWGLIKEHVESNMFIQEHREKYWNWEDMNLPKKEPWGGSLDERKTSTSEGNSCVSQSVCLLVSVGFLWDSFYFLTQLLISPTAHTASQINNIALTCWDVFGKLRSNPAVRWHFLKNKNGKRNVKKKTLMWSLRFNSVTEYIFQGTYHPAGPLPKTVCPLTTRGTILHSTV